MPSAVSLKSMLRRFRRHRRGSAAVEFALVAPVFFALLFAIVEVALMFFATQVLETVTQASARYLLTGQAQSGGLTQAQFNTYVCSQIPALFTCANMKINVQSSLRFRRSAITSPIDGSCNFVGARRTTAPATPAIRFSCSCPTNGRCSSPGSASTCLAGRPKRGG